jgi:hypothetical protein
MSPEEVRRFLLLMEKLRKMEVREEVEEMPPLPEEPTTEKLVEQLERKGTKDALTRASRPRRKRDHWKTKRRKHREYMQPYMAKRYRELIKPRRAKAASEGDWYEVYLMEWKKRGHKVELPRGVWDERVGPRIGDRVPVIFRLDTRKPVSAYNILVRDSETKEILYDGHEEQLRDLGAVE